MVGVSPLDTGEKKIVETRAKFKISTNHAKAAPCIAGTISQPLIHTDNVQVQRRWYLIRMNVTEKDCPAINYALGCVCTVCNRYIFTCSQQRKM